MAKISVVINTRNEERNLPRVMASVKGFADEIVVCDMESSDRTTIIAKKLGARVVSHKYVGYVEPVRDFAVSKAVNDWILVLDPDEEVPSDLKKKLLNIVKTPKNDYYRIPRKNIIFNKWIKYANWWPDYNIRFFKKGYVSWSEIIHSVPVTKGKGGELLPEERYAITHHNYRSVEEYIEKLNRYTSVQSDLKIKGGYKFSYFDLLKKPSAEFISRFFANQGYKDGVHGLALSLLQGFSELALYLKVWQKGNFEDLEVDLSDVKSEVGKIRKDVNYWFADALGQMFKRKFKIF